MGRLNERRRCHSLLLPFAFLSADVSGRSGWCQGRAVFARRSGPLTPPRPSLQWLWKAKGRRRRKAAPYRCLVSRALQVDRRRCTVGEALVEALVVIEMEVALDASFGL